MLSPEMLDAIRSQFMQGAATGNPFSGLGLAPTAGNPFGMATQAGGSSMPPPTTPAAPQIATQAPAGAPAPMAPTASPSVPAGPAGGFQPRQGFGGRGLFSAMMGRPQGGGFGGNRFGSMGFGG